jgi:hypothetical protein
MNPEVPAALAAIHAWAERVEYSPIGVAIAESRYAFMIIEGAHLIGLAFAVGLLFVVDLRLLGVFLRSVPLQQVMKSLRPWVLGGFALIFVTGVLLFWSSAGRLVQSPAFLIKLVLIGLAGANALLFELVIARSETVRQRPQELPLSVRSAGLASLVLWSLVIIFGRLIPYLPSWA